MSLEELDRRLQLGHGMRAQRIVEAGMLLLAIFLSDARFAWAGFVLTALQVVSPRAAPVALIATLVTRERAGHRLGDLYFDLAGSRGSCAISALIQAGALACFAQDQEVAARLILAAPAASFLLSSTIGFCAGCWFFVIGRDALARWGFVPRSLGGTCDVRLDP